jgi:hypothetical protein
MVSQFLKLLDFCSKERVLTKSGTLDNPKDFFEEVTRPNCNEFFNTPSSFKTAFGLAMSLHNICEWIFEFNKADLESKFGKAFSRHGDFWDEVQRIVPEAAFIRDLSNASKHVKLTINPSTMMTHIANTHIQTSSYGSGGYGQGRYGASAVVFHEGDRIVYFDDCAKKLFTFWEDLINDLYPIHNLAV